MVNSPIITFLYIGMLCASFLVTLVYIRYNWKNRLVGKLMSITLVLISYGLFTSFNAAQGFYIYLPHLARTGYLVLFLITPLLFLILKKGIPNQVLQKLDALHFLPALLYFINYLPFFILSGPEKVALISKDEFVSFDEGWFFPKFFVIYLSLSQILFYITLTCILVVFPSRKSTTLTASEKKFIYFFFMYFFLLLIPPMTSIYAGYSGNFSSSPIVLTYITSQTIFFLLLWGQPQIIYPKKVKVGEQVAPPLTLKLNVQTEKVTSGLPPLQQVQELAGLEKLILQKIQTIFYQGQPFLQEDFSQESLCSSLKISPYQLRKVLKLTYAISFNEFVNYHRINFLIQMLHSSTVWRNYSAASLASSIGFKSSNSLYIAFRKYLNTTPKEYIDQLKSS